MVLMMAQVEVTKAFSNPTIGFYKEVLGRIGLQFQLVSCADLTIKPFASRALPTYCTISGRDMTDSNIIHQGEDTHQGDQGDVHGLHLVRD